MLNVFRKTTNKFCLKCIFDLKKEPLRWYETNPEGAPTPL